MLGPKRPEPRGGLRFIEHWSSPQRARRPPPKSRAGHCGAHGGTARASPRASAREPMPSVIGGPSADGHDGEFGALYSTS